MKLGYIKVYIYADDHNPPHVHVDARDRSAVIEIKTGIVLKHKGFKDSELRALVQKIMEKQDMLLEFWESHNGDD